MHVKVYNYVKSEWARTLMYIQQLACTHTQNMYTYITPTCKINVCTCVPVTVQLLLVYIYLLLDATVLSVLPSVDKYHATKRDQNAGYMYTCCYVKNQPMSRRAGLGRLAIT